MRGLSLSLSWPMSLFLYFLSPTQGEEREWQSGFVGNLVSRQGHLTTQLEVSLEVNWVMYPLLWIQTTIYHLKIWCLHFHLFLRFAPAESVFVSFLHSCLLWFTEFSFQLYVCLLVCFTLLSDIIMKNSNKKISWSTSDHPCKQIMQMNCKKRRKAIL